MRLCLITNPGSGTSEQGDALRKDAPALGGEVWETQQPGDASDFAERAAAEGAGTVVACGGDGTVNEVVNGLMRVDASRRPRFAVVPLGTGNDLARTLSLPLDDPAAALRIAAEAATVVPLDVFHLRAADADRYGVNVAAGGFSGLVNEVMDGDLKKRWGPIAYLIGAAKALPDLEPFRVTLALDGETSVVDAYNVFVCNARCVAGGKSVAPYADPGDGWLDVVLVREGSTGDMARLAAMFSAGTHHDHALLAQFRARRVVLDSAPPMLFNVDGELVTQEPIAFDLVPGALQAVVGPGYVAMERALPEQSQVKTAFSDEAAALPPPPEP